jgi:hypothetical protein
VERAARNVRVRCKKGAVRWSGSCCDLAPLRTDGDEDEDETRARWQLAALHHRRSGPMQRAGEQSGTATQQQAAQWSKAEGSELIMTMAGSRRASRAKSSLLSTNADCPQHQAAYGGVLVYKCMHAHNAIWWPASCLAVPQSSYEAVVRDIRPVPRSKVPQLQSLRV